MNHLAYVLISYGVSVLVLGAMIIWILLDQRTLKAEMQRLEQQGIRRRSRKGNS